MRFIVLGAHVFKGNMGVFLRGCKTGMPQKFLNGAEIGATLQKVRSEAMPEGMGGQPAA